MGGGGFLLAIANPSNAAYRERRTRCDNKRSTLIHQENPSSNSDCRVHQRTAKMVYVKTNGENLSRTIRCTADQNVHLRELAAVHDSDLLLWLARGGANLLDGLHDVLALGNLTENAMLAVEPVANDGGDKELGTVGVGTGVGHGKQVRPVVAEDEVLISEFLAIDRFTTSAVAAGEVTTLKHELGNDAVKGGTLVVQRLAGLAHALLAGAQTPEVLRSLGSLVGEELHHNPLGRAAANGDVKENTRICHLPRVRCKRTI